MWPIKKQKWCEVRVKGAGRHLRRQTRESSFMLNNKTTLLGPNLWAYKLICLWALYRAVSRATDSRLYIMWPRAVAACSWPLNQAECWALRGDMWSLTERPAERRSPQTICLSRMVRLAVCCPPSPMSHLYLPQPFCLSGKQIALLDNARLGCSCESQSWKSVQDRVRHHILWGLERAKLLI